MNSFLNLSSTKLDQPKLEVVELKKSWVGSNSCLYDSNNPKVFIKTPKMNKLAQNSQIIFKEDEKIEESKEVNNIFVEDPSLGTYPFDMKYD